MIKSKRAAAFVLSTLMVGGLAPAQAQTVEPTPVFLPDEDNSDQRINLAGKLRMLSQRIPSATCYLTQGIDAQGAQNLLVSATAEFETILNALEFGDASVGIQSAESSRKSLHQIAEIREMWTPYESAASRVLDQTATEAEIRYLFEHDMALLEATQRLVERLSSQYANPNAMTGAAVMLIDISGRQRMLTQKISKEACLMGNPSFSASASGDPEATIKIFEASLDALRFGMPAVGISPPPNPEISYGLERVLADWNAVKPLILSAIAGEDMDDTAKASKFQGLNATMASMNTVVTLYIKATKSDVSSS